MAGRLTLAEQAIDCFGIDNQIRKAAEECSECAAALLKILDISAEETKDELVSKAIKEIADVKVCIEQLEKIFDLHAIQKAKYQKEGRLFDKICRARDGRIEQGGGDVSTGQAPWLQ